jgi:hypothetical protein
MATKGEMATKGRKENKEKNCSSLLSLRSFVAIPLFFVFSASSVAIPLFFVLLCVLCGYSFLPPQKLPQQHERRHARLKQSNPNLTLDEVYAESVKNRGVPLGRVGEAQEAGDVITFLASERASYLTGVAINIDGGTSAVV